MVRLKDRNKQIPGGLRFLQPETGYKPYPFSSLDTIVRQLIVHRHANPFLKEKNGWSVDYETVANEVDSFNAKICQEMGWGDYIIDESGESPKSSLPQEKGTAARAGAVVSKLAAGAATLGAWLGAGAVPVTPALANQRAATCADCPKNGKGDWKSYFTKKASQLVQAQLIERKNMNLSTDHDDKLGVCEACECPLKLKVHVPLDQILSKIPAESKAALDQRCWILHEG